MQTIRGGGVSEAFFKFVDLKTLPERMKNEETLNPRIPDEGWRLAQTPFCGKKERRKRCTDPCALPDPQHQRYQEVGNMN